MAITQFYTWSTGDTITAARLNGNISAIIDGGVGNYDSQHATDGSHKTITTSGTITAATGLTVTAGGLTITAGGQTITAGDLTMTAGNLGITSGSATLTSGSLTITSGDLILSDMATNSLMIADGSEIVSGATSGIPLVTNATGSAPAFGQITVKSKLPDVSQQLSTGSGTQTTASNTLVLLANSSINLTTLGRPVFVGIIPDSSAVTTASGCFLQARDTTSQGAVGFISMYRDTTLIATFQVKLSIDTSATEVEIRLVIPCNFFTIDPVGAGTYEYTLKYGCETGDIVDVSLVKLVAYEL